VGSASVAVTGSAAISSVGTVTVETEIPAPPNPFVRAVTPGAQTVQSFAGIISPATSADIASFSLQSQAFTVPGTDDPIILSVPLGRGFAKEMFATAGGDATIPLGTVGGSLVVSMTIISGEVQTQNYSMNVPLVPGATQNWSIVLVVTPQTNLYVKTQLNVSIRLRGSSASGTPLVRMMQFDLTQ
jgi:hypothetical protein